ncbi:Hypothetical protein PHPALM_6987 [Phytophthora palmivora]|uniref:Uncharacterized protein n=1 Tax=Phytophthora palmivora TaxID=4796 RepID=A0A2P4YDG1_9STRA|nr:Hypothetical protein PHPALM_6987 [Phytophthora palmivora]
MLETPIQHVSLKKYYVHTRVAVKMLCECAPQQDWVSPFNDTGEASLKILTEGHHQFSLRYTQPLLKTTALSFVALVFEAFISK